MRIPNPFAGKAITKDTGVRRREFHYQFGGVKLDFNLRVDVKHELKNFRALLEAAMTDVDAELDVLNEKKGPAQN